VFDFQNRRVLITGAGSNQGIGFATAKMLSALGAQVVITSTSDRIFDRTRDLGLDTSRAVVADLTNEAEAQHLLEVVQNELGGLDVLVNNAGMTSVASPAETSNEVAPLINLQLSGFEKSIERNLTTAFLVTQKALPLLRNGEHSRIVMVSSVTGSVMAMRNDVAYATAKAGLIGMVRSLALDEARFGITCNAVSPGWIATASQLPHESEEGKHTPLGRSATAEEVASVILFLSSREASYVTGQNVIVDGGNSIQEERTQA
jgi:3-oxoacyl-[acyl-carrier protein] reductase